MTSNANSTSGYEIDFGGGTNTNIAPSKSVLHAYAEARLRRTQAQKNFVSNKARTVKDAHDLVDAMVDFEKLRSGRMWKASDADILVKRYREALSIDLHQINLSQFKGLTGQRSWLDQHIKRLPPDNRHDHDVAVYDPKMTGWYFEKYFDYTGNASHSMQTYERFNDPTLGGDVTAGLRNPGPQDLASVLAETGRWMSYTPNKSGYVSGVSSFRTSYRILKRHVTPGVSPDVAVAFQSIDIAVGLLSGNDFIGRLYFQMLASNYIGQGVDGSPNLNQRDEGQNATYGMYSDAHVEKGENLQVMIGIRVKTGFSVKNIAINGAAEMRAYPSQFIVYTLDSIPSQAPPQW